GAKLAPQVTPVPLSQTCQQTAPLQLRRQFELNERFRQRRTDKSTIVQVKRHAPPPATTSACQLGADAGAAGSRACQCAARTYAPRRWLRADEAIGCCHPLRSPAGDPAAPTATANLHRWRVRRTDRWCAA